MPALLAQLCPVSPIEGTTVVRFELVNQGELDLFVLKQGTPLEGLLTDCLVVEAESKARVPYDGVLLVRRAAGPSEYICLKVGESVSNEVDVSDSYGLTVPGRYTVSFAGPVVCMTSPPSA